MAVSENTTFASTGRAAIAAHRARLSGMSIADLCAVYDGCVAAELAILGVINQPRTSPAASDFLSEEQERCFDEMDAAVRLLKSLAPANDDERDAWSRTIVDHRCIQCGDQPEAFFTLARELAAS